MREEKEWRKKPYWFVFRCVLGYLFRKTQPELLSNQPTSRPEQFVKKQLVDSDDEDEEESNMGKMPPSDSEDDE